jgi:hypothetical protein
MDLDGVIIGDDADVYINPWADWWSLKAWREPDISLWQTDYLFYPQGANLTFHSFSHLNTLVSLGLRGLFGVLPAYNLTIVLNIALSGIAMFHLGRYLTGSDFAGILAGVVFAFNSHAQYQSAHPVLVSIWCFPWLTVCFMRAVRENSIKWAFAAALVVFMGTLASTILLVLMGMWIVFLVLFMFLSSQWPKPTWRLLISFGLACTLLNLGLLYPLLSEAFFKGDSSFLMVPEESIRMDIITILIPHWYFWHVRGLYIGILPFYLGMLAFSGRRRESRLWWLLLIISFLFAIGPKPEILGYQIDVTLPWTLAVIPLLRNTYRVGVLLSLALAMLAAYGWVVFKERLPHSKGRPVAALLVLAAVYIDYTAALFPSTPIHVSKFYTEFLDEAPDDVILAVLPNGRQEGKRHLYYQTIHERKITGGVVSRADDIVLSFIRGNELLRAADADLDSVEIPEDVMTPLSALAERGITYLVLDKELMDVEPWRAVIPMMPLFEDRWVLVYSTTPGRVSG